LGSGISTCADKIINICNELKVLLSNDGTFNVYKQKLLGLLQWMSLAIGEIDYREDATIDLSKFAGGRWVTTDDGNRIFVDKDGNPIAGNPFVLQAISGAADKKAEREAAIKKYPRKDEMVCEHKVEYENHGAITKDKIGRIVTHFNHDENTMKITKQVKVEDALGKKYKICREPVEHLTVFASKDVGRGVDVADGLASQTDSTADSWKHVKGIGTVVDSEGNKRKADLHWFESPETGQVGWKIKQFLDDMSEEDKYWIEEGRKNGK